MSRYIVIQDSSIIHAVAYDHKTSILDIILKTNLNMAYSYEGISPEMFFEFISSESMGRFYSNVLKQRNTRQDYDNSCHFRSTAGGVCTLTKDHFGSHHCPVSNTTKS